MGNSDYKDVVVYSMKRSKEGKGNFILADFNKKGKIEKTSEP
jgi:hypothetical protein